MEHKPALPLPHSKPDAVLLPLSPTPFVSKGCGIVGAVGSAAHFMCVPTAPHREN